MNEAKEAIRQANAAKVAPQHHAEPLPPIKTDKAETAEYRRAVQSINRATESEMDRALCGR
jgi:hypothetical protein